MLPSATPDVRGAALGLLHALDPAAFARDRLGLDPDPWQVAFLRSAAPRVLLNITRQGGKSTSAAALALHTALHRPGSLILLVSPSLRQSGELFRKVVGFRDRLDPPPALEEDSALACKLANGSRVVCLPGNEGTVRGYSAPALIVEDEASRCGDALYRSLRPMLATSAGGRLILMSTPFGQRGHFHQEWAAGGDDWERVRVTAWEVPRIPPGFLAAERRALGGQWFAQEYEGEFLAGSDTVFRPEDVARAISAEVAPLFASAPAAGDVVPLFPRGP